MTSPGNIPRIHLYGASNLWLSRGAALTAVRRRFEGPLEIGLACGPGRSYGLRAGNPLARYLPLREVEFPSPAPPTLAVLSDVGNDIVYSQPPDTILVWVGELAGRLESQGAEVLLTGLPLESLRALPGWLFSALRSLYYAGQKLTQGELMQRLLDLEGGLQTLARERGYLFLPTQPEWYGFDRFHLRSKSYSACWEGWLERLQPDLGFQGQPTWRQLWQLKPQTYWYRGRPRQAAGEYDEVLPLTRVWVR
jgi:hypothetical protein